MSLKNEPPLDIPERKTVFPFAEQMSNWPWWLLVASLIGLFAIFKIVTDQQINVIFLAIIKGINLTLGVTFAAYCIAFIIGLFVGLGRVSRNKIIYNLATFYVEIVRGIPMLVLLMYIAFAAVPLVVTNLQDLGEWLISYNLDFFFSRWLTELTTRNISNTARVIIGLGVAYGAFSAEIFRAGIESIEKGQMEAARALGMTYTQSMRYVILPQAVRRVLPALGNDFVAMIKDSSLVSVLGVEDITQITKLYANSTFLFFESYSVLAFIYLVITILLTRVVRWLERRMSQ